MERAREKETDKKLQQRTGEKQTKKKNKRHFMKKEKQILFTLMLVLGQVMLGQKDFGLRQNFTLRGDFSIIGNTVIKAEDPQITENGYNIMNYIDIDGDSTTKNSSSANLQLIDNNNNNISVDECTKIKYARLYWFGRVDDCWNVNGEMEKRKKVKIKYGGGIYKDFEAKELYQIGGPTERVYVAYADVTDFVSVNKSGSYTVANVETMSSNDSGGGNRYEIETSYYSNLKKGFYYDYYGGQYYSSFPDDSWFYGDSGPHIYPESKPNPINLKTYKKDQKYNFTDQYGYPYGGFYDIYKFVNSFDCYSYGNMLSDGLGFFGGWTMVVVYENPKMEPKSVSLFDGLKLVRQNGGDIDVNISGFSTPMEGEIDVRLGMTVIEGDNGLVGDKFQVATKAGTYRDVQRVGSSRSDTFDGNIQGDAGRNPELQVSYGLDLAIVEGVNFPKPLDNAPESKIIYNGQTDLKTRFVTSGDTYYPVVYASSVSNYIPEPVGVGSYVGEETVELNPGDKAEFKIDVYNLGNEDIVGGKIFIPIPESVDFKLVSFTATTGKVEKVFGNIPPSDGMKERVVPNGYIVWDIGRDIPVTNEKDPKPLATLNYIVQVSKDCEKLRMLCSGEPISVTVDGFMRGRGKYSKLFLKEPSIIAKKGVVEESKCRKVVVPERDNAVKITRAESGEDCSYSETKQPIETCVGNTYEDGFPTFNLPYADNLNAGEKIQYDWSIWKVPKSGVLRVSTGGEKNRITGLQGRSPVNIGFGASGSWTEEYGKPKGFLNSVSTTITAPVPALGKDEEIYIKVDAKKIGSDGKEIAGCSNTEFTPISLMSQPAGDINSVIPPSPICAADGVIDVTSAKNKSTVLEEDPLTGRVINGTRYTLLYKIYKQGISEAEKEASPMLQAHFDGGGKAKIDLQRLAAGNYIYAPQWVTNGVCKISVKKEFPFFTINAEVKRAKLVSDGKTFGITPVADPGIVTKYKLYKKVVVVDKVAKTEIVEYRRIKVVGESYQYLAEGSQEMADWDAKEGTIAVEKDATGKIKEKKIYIPQLEGEYKVEAITEDTSNPQKCKGKEVGIIYVDKNKTFHYINPNLRIRVKQ